MLHIVDMRILSFSLAILFATVAMPSLGADWAGSETTRAGTIHVMNPATPIESAATTTPEELWRVGGDEDEDVLFGVITSVAVDSDGLVYLLDAQMNVVHVFSPEGEFLREIGREGEGPGEFRRAEDLFLTVDGNIAVMQRMPGKIVQITTGGDALENYKLPQGPEGGANDAWRGYHHRH